MIDMSATRRSDLVLEETLVTKARSVERATRADVGRIFESVPNGKMEGRLFDKNR